MPLSLGPELPPLLSNGRQRGSYTLVRKVRTRAARRQRPVEPLKVGRLLQLELQGSTPGQERQPGRSGRKVLRPDPVQELAELADELVRVALDGDVVVVRLDHETLGLHEVVGHVQR